MRTSERASRPQRNSGVGADTPTPDHDKIGQWTTRNGYQVVQQVYEGKVETWYTPEWEHAIVSKGRVQYVIGFIDLRIPVDIKHHYSDGREHVEHRALLLELKPQIESLGAVIRQVNLYRQYEHDYYRRADWGVVSPDSQFSAILEKQGIHFIKCPPAGDLSPSGFVTTRSDDLPF